MKTKKLLCTVLSFALLISTVSGSLIGGSTAVAAEAAAKVLAYVAVEDTTTGGAIQIAKKPVLLDEGATALDAVNVVLDANGYKDNYVTDASYGGSLVSIDGLGTVAVGNDWYYWNFGINGMSSNVALGTYEVQYNDQISLVYTSDYMDAECDSYKDSSENDPTATQAAALVDKAVQQKKILADKIFVNQFESGKVVPGVDDLNNLYTVFSLLRAEYSSNETTAFYDAVYSKIASQFADMKAGTPVYDTQGKEISLESIDNSKSAAQSYAKIALCVEALGKNPADVAGVNLIEKLADKSLYEASSIYSRESMILFAIDAMGAQLPEGSDYITRGDLVKAIVADVDNQIATSVSWNSLDGAAMAIQALAPYVSTGVENVSADEIKTATDKVFGLLITMQESDASFGKSSFYTQGNVWTLAQVMVTIGVFGIRPTQDATYDFVKNGKTVFDVAASFVNTSDATVDEGLMGFQPEQLLRGLDACIRVEEAKNSIYDLNDDVVYTAKDSTKTKLTIDMIQSIPAQDYKEDGCEPEVVVTANGKVLTKDTDYCVAYFDNDEVGDKTASVVVTGIGGYYMSQKVMFSIVNKTETPTVSPNPTATNSPQPTNSPQTPTATKTPAKAASLKKPVIKKVVAGKKSLTVTFGKVKNAKKYVVEVSTSKKFKKVTKKTVKTTKAVMKKLSSKKKYYVRVRAISGNSKSAYSKVKSKKTK